MNKNILVVALSLGAVALFGAMSNALNVEMDVSASTTSCAVSKDQSQASPGGFGSKQECNKALGKEHKDFECEK